MLDAAPRPRPRSDGAGAGGAVTAALPPSVERGGGRRVPPPRSRVGSGRSPPRPLGGAGGRFRGAPVGAPPPAPGRRALPAGRRERGAKGNRRAPLAAAAGGVSLQRAAEKGDLFFF